MKTKVFTYHSIIINDIDGGYNLPRLNYFIAGLGQAYYPDNFEEKNWNLVFSTLDKSELKYPELKDKFEAMQKKRDPDDNPLLMIFRMK